MRGTVKIDRYAYIPEQPVYYDYLTLEEHIALVLELTNVDNRERTEEHEAKSDDSVGAHPRGEVSPCR